MLSFCKSDIDACYEALKDAVSQIHVFIATSRFTASISSIRTGKLLESYQGTCFLCTVKFEIVEFSPEDATRTELDFSLKSFKQRSMQVHLISTS